MSVATIDDVATSLGRPALTAEESAQWERWLDNAEMQIRLRLGPVDLLDQEALAFVEAESVILKIRNPDGKQNERIDDYSYGRASANAQGQIVILPEWWNMLDPSTGSGAFSVRPYFEPDEPVYAPWVNLG